MARDEAQAAEMVIGDAASAVSWDGRALLQIWLSPAFPVGGFAYSHGLEKAVENGWIVGRAGLEAWLGDLVEVGSPRNDLILLAVAWRTTTDRADDALHACAETGLALQPSAERHLEATQQGQSFLAQIEAAWPVTGAGAGADAAAARDWRTIVGDIAPTYPVAVGFAAARHGIALGDTLLAYAIAFVGALTSAAIRLGVVGQTDAQRVTAALLARLRAAVAVAEAAALDDLGGAAWRSDLASLQHEAQYTRLFRS